jgi:hypothetical protein
LTEAPITCPNKNCETKLKKNDIMYFFGKNWFYGMLWNYIEARMMSVQDKEMYNTYKKNIQGAEREIVKY